MSNSMSEIAPSDTKCLQFHQSNCQERHKRGIPSPNVFMPQPHGHMQGVLVGKEGDEPRSCVDHRCNTSFFQLVVQMWQVIQQELTEEEQCDVENDKASVFALRS